MSKEMFEQMITYFGEENILGFGFDNSAGVTFTKENKFSLAQNYNADIESLMFICFDSKGNPFHVIKHVENIQAVYVRDSNVDFGDYDRITIRG